MRKWLLICIPIIILIVYIGIAFLNKNNKESNPSGKLLDYGKYVNIKLENIKKIEIVKYTEAGDKTEVIEDKTEIYRTYNKLKEKTIGRKSLIMTTDNTTVYRFILNDDTKVSIEIENNCVVIDGERYILK